MWPTFTYCQILNSNLSENFRAQYHSFSGTWAQKLATTAVQFVNPAIIDFLPEEVTAEFPLLNAIMIHDCPTFTIIKNGLFTENFNNLQYLWLPGNKIQTIEANAFQHLVKLKWIRLNKNEIQSLPYQFFKNNPKIMYIDLQNNKINSIDSRFFENLKKLNFVGFVGSNLCISKAFGCDTSTCSVTQEDLDIGLVTCYSNCVKDMECALKSGKFDLLNPSYVEANIDAIVSYGHLDVLIAENYTDLLFKKNYLNLMVENGFLDLLVARNYLDPLIQNGHLGLLIEKNYTDLLIEKGYKNQIIENDWRLKLAYKDIRSSNETRAVEKVIFVDQANQTVRKDSLLVDLEKTVEELKELKQILLLQTSEAKLLMENERLKYKVDKQATDFEVNTLRRDLADLKDKFDKFELCGRR
jgi:hypothetical protein